MPHRANHCKGKVLKKTFITSLILGGAVLATAALLVQVRRTPHFHAVKAAYRSSDLAILDRNGLVVDEIPIAKNVRRLNWVALNKVPPAFVDALLTAEDKRFFYHLGFDPLGGKTITLQLAELLENSPGRSKELKRKLAQIWQAFVIEISWNKHDILEAYMNLVTYRGEIQGIAAASYGLFDKAPQELTRQEAAVIAALIRSPNTGVARVQKRACWILARMGVAEDCGLLTEAHLSYIEESYQIRPFIKMAPEFAKRLAASPEITRGSLVRSTLDRDIQWAAMHSLQRLKDGAVIVIENSTGNVLAYVGKVLAKGAASDVDEVLADRQAGSTLTPLIYGKALDERILTAATLLGDSPLAISITTGMYRPENFEKTSPNLVSVRTSLALNLNIPAVRALELLGVDIFVHSMSDFGFTKLARSDFYGPSLALGAADVSLIELTNAYRALANGGMWSPLRFSPDKLSELAAKRVISEAAAFIVSDIMTDRQSSFSNHSWTAVKTGSSWSVGYSDKYTVGVWAERAQPVWHEVMNYLHRQDVSYAPKPPQGLVQEPVSFGHDKARRDEWFIAGTEPTHQTALAKPDVHSRISYPIDRSLIALDPDTPRDNHRMFIQILEPQGDQNLYLNGQRIGRARPFQPWEPRSGKFNLELRDSRGNVVDRVHFQVRGRTFALNF